MLFISFFFESEMFSQSRVPEITKKEFAARYPGIKEVEWEVTQRLFIAHFNILDQKKGGEKGADGSCAVSFYSTGENYGKWFLSVRNYLYETDYSKLIPDSILSKMKEKIKSLDQPEIGRVVIVECAEKYYGGIHQRAYLLWAYDPAKKADSESMRYFTFEGELVR